MPYAAGRGAAEAWRRISVDIDGDDVCYATAYRHRAAHRRIGPGAHLVRITGTDNSNGDLLYIAVQIVIAPDQPMMVAIYPASASGRPSRVFASTYGTAGWKDAPIQVVTYEDPGRLSG